MLEKANIRKVIFDRGLLADRINTNRQVTLQTEYEQLKNTGRLYCMKMDWQEGMPNRPHEFWDSDIAKWIEACAYSLSTGKDDTLENMVDEIIDIMEISQQEDGYLNTYYQTVEKNNRFTNLKDRHELYCAGHLMEAAVAYYEATNKDKFLQIMCRYADLLYSIFGKEEGKLKGYPGHEEIELALIKLYEVTHNENYLELASFFVLERGQSPHYYDQERANAKDGITFHHYEVPSLKKYAYVQAHEPVLSQTTVEGHAVRALYYLCGVADVAYKTNNEALKKACKRLYTNIVTKRMYITGGVGSSLKVENFSFDYDLPNETAYGETCAAIALAFFTHRMFIYEQDGQYMDIFEKVLYNGLLSGMSIDGTKFFYANPLAVNKKAVDMDTLMLKGHMGYERRKWFGCACCPPNIARFLASLGQYTYATDHDDIYVNLYSEGSFTHKGVKVIQKTTYPYDEKINISLQMDESKSFTLALRLPSWCKKYTLMYHQKEIKGELIKGYLHIKKEFHDKDQLTLTLFMPVVKMQSHPFIRQNTNTLALQRGPVIYCAEQVDNKDITLSSLYVSAKDQFTVVYDSKLLGGCAYLRGILKEMKTSSFKDTLYKEYEGNHYADKEVTFIPYSLWGNRELGDMVIFFNKRC